MNFQEELTLPPIFKFSHVEGLFWDILIMLRAHLEAEAMDCVRPCVSACINKQVVAVARARARACVCVWGG